MSKQYIITEERLTAMMTAAFRKGPEFRSFMGEWLHGLQESAAPDLAEALQYVQKFYQENFDIMPVAFQTVDNIISQALTKAGINGKKGGRPKSKKIVIVYSLHGVEIGRHKTGDDYTADNLREWTDWLNDAALDHPGLPCDADGYLVTGWEFELRED